MSYSHRPSEFWVCPAHHKEALRGAVEDGLLAGTILGGSAIPPWGLDMDVILRVSYPRRYGGGTGVGRCDQLPLDMCWYCEGEWE